jgi:hypothetical protein
LKNCAAQPWKKYRCRMSDTPANLNPFRLSPGDAFGFSDAGERVAVTWPENQESNEADQGDHIDRLADWFDWLDRGDDHAVLLRIKLLRHICGKSNCGTDAEFAAKYGLSKGRISQLRKEIKSELGRLGNCNNRRR